MTRSPSASTASRSRCAPAPPSPTSWPTLTDEDDPKGVAVAVDRCVVPRSEWATTPARAGSLVEVVTAAAGG